MLKPASLTEVKAGLDHELMKKLQREKKFYQLKQENMREDLETKKLNVLEMDYHLAVMKKDLARSEALLDMLRDNGL